LILRRRGQIAPAMSTNQDPIESRQVLVERIAALDDQFEKGGLSEEEYADRRSRLKALLASAAQTSNPSA
jgi:hypothetical protein